jgi:hypothetical protein
MLSSLVVLAAVGGGLAIRIHRSVIVSTPKSDFSSKKKPAISGRLKKFSILLPRFHFIRRNNGANWVNFLNFFSR